MYLFNLLMEFTECLILFLKFTLLVYFVQRFEAERHTGHQDSSSRT